MAEDDSPNQAPTAAYLALAAGVGGSLIAVLLRVTGLIAVDSTCPYRGFCSCGDRRLRFSSARGVESPPTIDTTEGSQSCRAADVRRWDKLRELSIELADA